MPDGENVKVAKINSAYDVTEYLAQRKVVVKMKRKVHRLTLKEIVRLKKLFWNRNQSRVHTDKNRTVKVEDVSPEGLDDAPGGLKDHLKHVYDMSFGRIHHIIKA